MGLQYVLLFGATGVSLPFAGLWLRSQGLTGAEIGILLSAPMLGRLVTGPLIAVWADGFRLRRTAIVLLGLAAAAGYGAAGLVEGFAAWAACWFVGATAAAALIPLTDALTLRLARGEGFTFAVPRGFGSVAFVAANLVMGGLLTRAPADAVIVWLTTAGALIALAAWRIVPAEPVGAEAATSKRERFKGLGRLVADPAFMAAILAVGAVQAAHAFYYAFSAIIWKAQGLSEAVSGALWGVAVAAEIAFMWVIEPWRRKAGIDGRTLLVVGAIAALARWCALAASPPLWLLWPLQALHALSFAATYLAGLELVERLCPPKAHTAGQTLNSMLSSGVLIGMATVLSGPLYDASGAHGYMAMAAMAAIGGGVALAFVRPGQGVSPDHPPLRPEA